MKEKGGTQPKAQCPLSVGDRTHILWQVTSQKFLVVGGRGLKSDGLWPCSVKSRIPRASGKGRRVGGGGLKTPARQDRQPEGPARRNLEKARQAGGGAPGGRDWGNGPGLAYQAIVGAAQNRQGNRASRAVRTSSD